MANILDNLTILDQNLDAAKTTLANNLTSKGVPSTTGDTLTAMANKVAEISGGGGGDLDWSAIGYDKRPEVIDNEYNYSKEIYDNWDATQTDLSSKFIRNFKIKYMPLVNTSNATNMRDMFSECSNLEFIPQLDTNKVTDMYRMFGRCENLTVIPQLNTQNVSYMEYMFASCVRLTTISQLNIQNVTNMEDIFNSCINLRKINITNLGTRQELTNIDFLGASWGPNNLVGIDGDGITGCRQALVDTLLTNSFDRATAGYPICTIKLAPDSKAVLTAEEVTAIEAKGYTIVTA